MLEAAMYNVFEFKKDMTDDCYNKICQTFKDLKEEIDGKQANQPQLYTVKYSLTNTYIKKDVHVCDCDDDRDVDIENRVCSTSTTITTIMYSVPQSTYGYSHCFSQGQLICKDGKPRIEQGHTLQLTNNGDCMLTATIISIEKYERYSGDSIILAL